MLVAVFAFTLISGMGVAQTGQEGDEADSDRRFQCGPARHQSATKDQLSALPGIDYVYSQEIIGNWPYKTKTDLVRKKVIPAATCKKIATKSFSPAEVGFYMPECRRWQL
jgi:hypothetical protein